MAIRAGQKVTGSLLLLAKPTQLLYGTIDLEMNLVTSW